MSNLKMQIEKFDIQRVIDRTEKEERRFIQVIYGPRQVGKTTMTLKFAQTTEMPSHFVSADAVPASDSEWIRQQWVAARMLVPAQGTQGAVLIIDEVQKIDNWSEWVKREWDADTRNNVRLKVILLGSSRLLLQQGLTESLMGRFETTYVNHWSFNEMHEAFGVTAEEFVWFGGYPGAAPLMADEERWKGYIRDSIIETSISKDILMLTRVDKPALMKRLFELGCSYSGQMLSYTKVLGQLQDAGNTTTLSHYLDLLGQAGLLEGLEKYSPERMRQRASSPKFQVHNTALMSAQQPMTFAEVRQQPVVWGRWVESAIGAHLLNTAAKHGLRLHYWRHREDEVDYILEDHGRAVAIEVKSGPGRRVSGMVAFNKKYAPHRTFLVGDAGMPWQDFLTIDPKSLLKPL